MEISKLIYMANQIAKNLTYSSDLEAIDATQDHIEKFWDPKMRFLLKNHVVSGGEGLSDIVIKASKKLN